MKKLTEGDGGIFDAGYYAENNPDMPNAAIGSFVAYDIYEQENNPENGQKPIEWTVNISVCRKE